MLKVRDLLQDKEIFRREDAPENPLISVIMPIYCHNGILLERAIESVLNQTFKDFELIIVDDGSRDGSFETAQRYMKEDNRINIIRHTLNCGLPALRVNEGILESRGNYIAYQFDDDEYLPNCLEDLYNEIIKHLEPCVVYGATLLEMENKQTTRRLGLQFDYSSLVACNQIANNAVLHQKEVMNITGMYDPHVILRRLCDYDLWLRMGQYVPF
jgi:O-antigen biosynthesis protein